MSFFDYFRKASRASAMGMLPPPMPVPVASIGSSEQALRVSAVYACVRILAETIACLPKCVYSYADGKEQPDDPVENLLNFAPNEYMCSVDFWVYVLHGILLRGNGYAAIERSVGGTARLIPFDPAQVTSVQLTVDPVTGAYSKLFSVQGKTIADANMLHFCGPSLAINGLVGVPILERYALATVNNASQVEAYSTEAFRKGTNLSGVVQVANTLAPVNKTALRTELDALHSGLSAGGRLAILDGGAVMNPITLSPDDTKFLASRNFSIEEICRWFGVPLHLVQNGQQQSYNSNESNGGAFQTYTLLPLCKRLEQQCSRKLFPARDKYIEFSFDSLLRPAVKERYEANLKACGRPFKTVNEVRASENLPPAPDGDKLASPMNMGTSPSPLQGGNNES